MKMKIKIIRNKRYAAIQLEDKRHAEDLLMQKKIIGYSMYDGIVEAYFPL